MSNYIKAPETQVYQPSGSQVVTATTVGPKTALDVNVVGGGGGGGGGGDVILKDDAAQRLSLVDVAGIKKVPTTADVTLTAADDSISVRSPTTNLAVEPNADGSLAATMDGLLERMVMKALARLSYSTANEVRVTTSGTVAANLNAGVNNIGLVTALIGPINTNGTGQMISTEAYQMSFRKNLTVT